MKNNTNNNHDVEVKNDAAADAAAESNATQEAATTPAQPDNAALDRLIADAEQRGYLRGRNEKIAMAMEQWETSVDLAPDLLVAPRKSMWD